MKVFQNIPSLFRNTLVFALIGFATTGAMAKEKPQLSASLIVNKDKLELAPEYKGEVFRKKVEKLQKEGEPMPPAQNVNFILRITNESEESAVIKVGGDESTIQLRLDGKNALNVDSMMMFTADYRSGKNVTIKAGKFMDLPIKSLASGKRGMAKLAYFTETGDHKLSAIFRSQGADNQKLVSLEAEAVSFTVIESK